MDDPGRTLRRARESLRLKYRDVEEASQRVARLRQNQEFAIGLSRLADIENKGTPPSFHRLYSLCVIYGLRFETVLTWYGIDLNDLLGDAARVGIRETRLVDYTEGQGMIENVPLEIDQSVDLTKTVYLSLHVRRWGNLPLSILSSLDFQRHRYAFIGTEDWFMHPILPPGSFVQIDETKQRLDAEGATQEYEKPIHFIEHRTGYRCGWCSERNGLLIVQPSPGSGMKIEVYRFPGEADIIGQVIGVAKRLDLARKRHTRF